MMYSVAAQQCQAIGTHSEALRGLDRGCSGAVALACCSCERQTLRRHLSAELAHLPVHLLYVLCLHAGCKPLKNHVSTPCKALALPMDSHHWMPRPPLSVMVQEDRG